MQVTHETILLCILDGQRERERFTPRRIFRFTTRILSSKSSPSSHSDTETHLVQFPALSMTGNRLDEDNEDFYLNIFRVRIS